MFQLNDLLIDNKVARAHVEQELFRARLERMTRDVSAEQPTWMAHLSCCVALSLGRALIALGQHLQHYAARRTTVSLKA